MGLFDFLKPGYIASTRSANRQPNDIVFKSGRDAIEYVRSSMKTEWKANSVVVGLFGQSNLERGILSADVLIPKDDGFIAMPTHTSIKAVHSPQTGRVPLNGSSDIRHLDLKFGDLVSVHIAGQDKELRKLYPETEGWVAFVIGKNSLTYSLRQSGWIVEKKYEM